jgi:hypothetical protein
MEEVAGRAAAGAARIATLRGAEGGAFGKKDDTATLIVILLFRQVAHAREAAIFARSTNAGAGKLSFSTSKYM